MKIKLSLPFRKSLHFKHGFLEVDLLVALAILSLAIVPIGFSFAHERQALKLEYFSGVINEIVDGEMEVLVAGDWRTFPAGDHDYAIHSDAAANLPPGKFLLLIESGKVRLEWRPDEKHHGGPVVREAMVK